MTIHMCDRCSSEEDLAVIIINRTRWVDWAEMELCGDCRAEFTRLIKAFLKPGRR